MEEYIKFLKRMGIELNESDIKPVIIRIPVETKPDDNRELLAYRRINEIATTDCDKVKWEEVIKYLTLDVLYIAECIANNKLYHKDELEKFTENCCAIMQVWDDMYRDTFNSIKEFRDKKDEPSDLDIDKMNASALREYIRTHNIK